MKESVNSISNRVHAANKSNGSSLKTILNQGRVPLSQYINEKAVKKDASYSNLTYFEKLKAMFNKGESKYVHQKQIRGQGSQKDVIKQKRGSQDQFASFLNNHELPLRKLNFNKEKLQTYDPKCKERSKSINIRSQSKNEKIKRLETTANTHTLARVGGYLTRNHHKTYTQTESLETCQKDVSPVFMQKYKTVKKQTINYGKFSLMYSNGEVDAGLIQLGEILGSGANAIVRLGRQLKSGQLFAIKIYEKYKLVEPNKKKRVSQEIDILSKIHHQNIIKMFSCFEDKRQIHILFEYIRNAETLQDYLKSHLYEATIDVKNEFAVKVVEAIRHIHSKGISHRDIKTENVMIGENGIVKLIDFGFATTSIKGETHCGTPNYMAPELFYKKSIYNPFQVDIWALGILLYYLYEGCYPFRGYDEKDLSRSISLGLFAFKKCDIIMRQIINSALRVDPKERITLESIKFSIKQQIREVVEQK